VGHAGLASVRLEGTRDTTIWLAVQSEPIAVREGSQYVLVAWGKTKDVVKAPEQYLNSDAYIQFLDASGAVVRMGRSPVRATPKVLGTADWRELQRVVKVPDGAVMARVGVALTCTGTAWFDQVELHEVTNVVWHQTETDRFVYHGEANQEPRPVVITANKKYLESIERILGIKVDGKIPFYRYESVDRLRQLTGRQSKGHYTGREIHALRWDDRSAYVGVVMSTVGETTLFIGVGTATYCARKIQGQSGHPDAKKMIADGIVPNLVELNQADIARAYPAGMFRTLATSFVEYLVDQYGVDKLKKLFSFKDEATAETTLDQTVYQLYHRTLDQLQDDWMSFLKSQ